MTEADLQIRHFTPDTLPVVETRQDATGPSLRLRLRLPFCLCAPEGAAANLPHPEDRRLRVWDEHGAPVAPCAFREVTALDRFWRQSLFSFDLLRPYALMKPLFAPTGPS